MMTMKT